MKILLALLTTATLAFAGEVTKSQPLPIVNGYDPLYAARVAIQAKETRSSGRKSDLQTKEIEASVAPSSFAPFKIECCFLVERESGTDKGKERVLSAGQADISPDGGTVNFLVKNSNSSDTIKGWFIRLVNGDRIVGVAGSSEKFLAMAADPKTEVRYREK